MRGASSREVGWREPRVRPAPLPPRATVPPCAFSPHLARHHRMVRRMVPHILSCRRQPASAAGGWSSCKRGLSALLLPIAIQRMWHSLPVQPGRWLASKPHVFLLSDRASSGASSRRRRSACAAGSRVTGARCTRETARVRAGGATKYRRWTRETSAAYATVPRRFREGSWRSSRSPASAAPVGSHRARRAPAPRRRGRGGPPGACESLRRGHTRLPLRY